MGEENKEKMRLRGTGTVITILLILAVMLCLFVMVQTLSNGYVNIGGFMMFRVVTGSMEPTLSVGTLLVTQQVDMETIEINDIICFRAENIQIRGSIVTHRVKDIVLDENGEIFLQTQGDANPVADGYYVSQDNFVGKVIWHTGDHSMLASVFSIFTNKVGFLGMIVFPCLLLGGIIMRSCVNNIREELRRAKEEMQNPSQLENPLDSMTKQEYEAMIERIRAELIQKLADSAETLGGERNVGIQEPSETTE